MSRYNSILETIGDTPLVRINWMAPAEVNLYVKVESFNPMGSVKDRLALGVIEDAEERGLLRPGQTVIEATSGNTGIGLAMVCAQKGYPLVVTMAENFSVERRRLMRFLGAKVVLTPASEMGSGMLNKAAELAAAHGWFLCRQFENEANADIHSRTTAVEILNDFDGERLDAWVSGYGTGGTLKGVARVLKQHSPDTQVVVCEPDNAPVLASGIAQPRHDDGTPAASHPYFRPHLMQGWAPDFVAKLTEDAKNSDYIDRILAISGVEALHCAHRLARKEGIFCGISGGATLAGALVLSEELPPGSNLVCMLPDTGERYQSTPLFEDIGSDMSDEEWDISRSTPGYRFDTEDEDEANDAPGGEPPPISAEQDAQLAAFLNDPEHPVVMFALEWCEFCWSVRKLFARCDIPFRSIDLDSVEYQKGDRGGQIKDALSAHTGCPTIPQVFVRGRFIGGCTETFDAFKSGELQLLLSDAEVEFERAPDLDPYSLFPSWLQQR